MPPKKAAAKKVVFSEEPKAPTAAATKKAAAAAVAATKKAAAAAVTAAKKVAAAPAKKTDKPVVVAAPVAAPKKVAPVPSGVIVPKQAPATKRAPPQKRAREESTSVKKTSKQDEESASDDEDDDEDLSSSSSDDMSDLADGSSSDDDSDNEVESKTKKSRSEIAYKVLQLRYLPQAFQEPQLQQFLSQFGARVTNCFCVRSRRTNEPKGTAYVQFDDEKVLPIVLEECDGMALGGRTLRARVRTLHRAMPKKQNSRIRRLKGERHEAHGAKLIRHDVGKKPLVAQLIKYSRAERRNNEALKAMGIDFVTHGFQQQVERLPKDLFLSKEERAAKKASQTEDVMKFAQPTSSSTEAAATTTPAAASSPGKQQEKQAKAPAAKAPVKAPAKAPTKAPAKGRPAKSVPAGIVVPKEDKRPAPSKK